MYAFPCNKNGYSKDAIMGFSGLLEVEMKLLSLVQEKFCRALSYIAVIILMGISTISQAQSSDTVRIRGLIEKIQDNAIYIKDRGGETVRLAMPEGLNIREVYPINIADIQQNSYIGTTALPDSNNRLVALEVHVFPEAMRGTGEGHRPWDLQPGSSMTNATVASVVSIGKSREIQLKYKDGEKTIFVPESASIVTYRQGSLDLLIPGAQAIVVASEKNGVPTALTVTAGKNGFKPPM